MGEFVEQLAGKGEEVRGKKEGSEEGDEGKGPGDAVGEWEKAEEGEGTVGIGGGKGRDSAGKDGVKGGRRGGVEEHVAEEGGEEREEARGGGEGGKKGGVDGDSVAVGGVAEGSGAKELESSEGILLLADQLD